LRPRSSTTHGLLELALDQPLLAAPPAWLDDDRVALIGGATTEPTALIVDVTTGAIEAGPTGDRRIAISLDTEVVATSAGPGSSVDIGATSAWLEDSDVSTGSIDATDEDATAISIALDRTGVRLAIVWVDGDGSVRLTVHDGDDGWRPSPGPAAVAQDVGTGSPAEKIETWASSGIITPMTFCRVRRWTHEPQLSK
jgi:hypothetical protein